MAFAWMGIAQAAVGALVAPERRAGRRVRTRLHEGNGEIAIGGRPQLVDRHAKKLGTRVPVGLARRVVDIQETQGRDLEDPHRLRVTQEDLAIGFGLARPQHQFARRARTRRVRESRSCGWMRVKKPSSAAEVSVLKSATK